MAVKGTYPEAETKLRAFNFSLNAMAALFLGRPPARPLRFDPTATNVHWNSGSWWAPASLLQSTGPIVPSIKRKRVVDILIPSDAFLLRSLDLPISARGKLAEIALLDLLRKTPFEAGDVLTALSKPVVDGKSLRVRQWVIKKSELFGVIERLEAIGLRVRQVRVGDGECLQIVDRSSAIAPRGRTWRRFNAGLVLAGAGLGLLAWIYPAWKAHNALSELESVRSERQADLLTLRRQVEARSSVSGQDQEFLRAVIHQPRLVEIVRALTVTFPDDVWVSDLTLRDGRLTISGETSGSATDLVLRLAEGKTFSDPRLSGPVSRLAGGGERFQLSLDVGRN